MDVQDLAPALLALADIVQLANRKFNGDAADIRVLVNADVEQQCFQIELSLVQSVFEQAKGFFADERVATAKEIAEWIGIVAGATGTAGLGLFKLITWLAKRPKSDGTTFTVTTENGVTTLIDGDGNHVSVNHHVYLLASDPAVIEKAKRVVQPLQKPGYDTLQFVDGDSVVETIDKAEAGLAADLAPTVLDQSHEDISSIRGHLRIKSAQYEGNAKWSVLWGGRAIDVSMPPDFVKAFQHNELDAPPNTLLDVQMEQRVALDDTGKAVGAPAYKVVQVHEITLPPRPTTQVDWITQSEASGQSSQDSPAVTRRRVSRARKIGLAKPKSGES
ncbi:hypothetical protein IP78_12785 [Brevundimonas sp. AAP58]|uniref:hypothetical protein n=1 Tax=Brevundimonas sp. AAP58 TaxID=1523422 RepID=UPI0006CC3ABD|nr:hypothetical protein [Brevundimonas sp. AAP58]KPF77490.1 hypothetical protein IP78_12785 [Brevundimonas sp. AAP58]